ncbi:hypothetical protein MRB53_024189 [Persea americana]|uniref:Uncharacterized protein n=1 Tax=Persea americana TaxID=3435 RepID=A0ACC2LBJ9_PERAE|nr:hypothetical protein MRB53_024189 [Persea americana]
MEWNGMSGFIKEKSGPHSADVSIRPHSSLFVKEHTNKSIHDTEARQRKQDTKNAPTSRKHTCQLRMSSAPNTPKKTVEEVESNGEGQTLI